MDDLELLRQYAGSPAAVDHGAQDALGRLAERYVDLVYSAALRQVRDPHTAADVTQNVFVVLLRNARRIRPGTPLGPWLLRVTRYAAVDAIRAEARRRRHEQEAARMAEAIQPQPDEGEWQQIAPLLDEAISRLGERNRSALVLQYFQGLSGSEVARRLKISEEAARQRVSRALDQLRKFFLKKDVATSAGTLGATLAAYAVQAAPPAVVATVASTSTVALATGTGTGAAAALAKGAMAIMAWTKAQAAAVGVIALLVVGGTTTVVLRQTVFRANRSEKVVVVAPAPPARPALPPPASNARFSGLVLTGNGTPMPDAEVLFATPTSYVRISPANVPMLAPPAPDRPLPLSRGIEQAIASAPPPPSGRSGLDGRIDLDVPGDWTAVVVRCAAGYAQLSRDQSAAAQGQIVIQPWGRIEGTIYWNGKPMPEEIICMDALIDPDTVELRPVTVNGLENAWQYLYPKIVHATTARTDAAGHFVFDHIAPTLVVLKSKDDRTWLVDVQPGTTTTVSIGNAGRTVIGRLTVPGVESLPPYKARLWSTTTSVAAQLPVNWAELPAQRQELHKARVRVLTEGTDQEHDAALVAALRKVNHLTTQPSSADALAKAMAELQAQRQFQPRMLTDSLAKWNCLFDLDSDGSLRIDGVAAGSYHLSIFAQTSAGRQLITKVAPIDFTIPETADGHSTEPLDLGQITASVVSAVILGQRAPDLQGKAPDGSAWNLADQRGKYVVAFSAKPEWTLNLAPIWDHFHGDPRFVMVQFEMGASPAQIQPSGQEAGVGWMKLSADANSPAMLYFNDTRLLAYVIGPDGNVLVRAGGTTALYSAVDAGIGQGSHGRDGVKVAVEHQAGRQSPEFKFEKIPSPSADDAGSGAVFELVDGQKASYGGSRDVLNDGKTPRGSNDEAGMFSLAELSMEGRLRADLGKAISIAQVNTYSWYRNGNRWPQVYCLYGSDGTDAKFNSAPKVGTDPAACGWKFIAMVDTRATPGGTDLHDGMEGRDGASVSGDIGQCRYLLFNIFPTKASDHYGETFWSEIDIVEKK